MTTVPSNREQPIDPKTGTFSAPWDRFFRSLASALAVDSQTVETEATVSGFGLVVRNRFGQIARTLTSSTLQLADPAGTEDNPAIDLAPLANTTIGESMKVTTIDAYGRTEGYVDATAADLPFDPTASGVAATDVQAALDLALALGGISRTIASISTNTTAGAFGDYVYFVTGTTTVTLPTAVGNAGQYTVKNVGAGTVTVDTTGSETIDGAASQSLPYPDALTLVSDGANWNIV